MAGTVGADEVEAAERLFAVGFVCGDLAEAGGTVNPAVFADPAEQGGFRR
jgi:hypothetical protein